MRVRVLSLTEQVLWEGEWLWPLPEKGSRIVVDGAELYVREVVWKLAAKELSAYVVAVEMRGWGCPPAAQPPAPAQGDLQLEAPPPSPRRARGRR